jgi:hypothetical protein
MINDAYTSPPVDIQPAEIQTIDANQQQQFSSPEQSAISDINLGKYGEGFTASMPESSQDNAFQDACDLNENVEGIGQGAANLAEASKKGEEVSNLDNALQDPGYADHCDPPAQNEGMNHFVRR